MALSENDRHDALLHREQRFASEVWSFAPILRHRIRLIGLVTLGFALTGLIYVALSTPRYMASGRILIDRPAAEVEAQIAAITSRAVLGKAVAREKLQENPSFGGKSKGLLSMLLIGLGLTPPADPNAVALQQLERTISVKHEAKSNLVDVYAVTRDRDVSIRAVNAVMDSYIEQQVGVPDETAYRAEVSSDAQPGALQARLKDAQQRYEKFRSEAGSAVANGAPAGEKQVKMLSDRLAAAEVKVEDLRSTLARTRRTSEPNRTRGPTIDVLRRRYAAAKRLQDDLSRTLGPRHPDMVIATLQTNEAKRSLDQAVRERTEDKAQSTAVELERSRTVVADLKGRLELAKKDMGQAKDTVARLRELERDVEVSRAAYQAFLDQSREPSERQRSSMPAIKIITRAAVASDSVGTPRFLVLLTSILLGLVSGVLLALLLELRPEWSRRSQA